MLRFDPEQGKVMLTPILADLCVEGISLHEHFRISHEAGCAVALEKLLGCEKIYYSSATNYNLSRMLNSKIFGGGVTLDWKYVVNHQDPDDSKRRPNNKEEWTRSISVSPEKRIFSGGEVIRLLNWPGWPGGVDEKCDFYAEMWRNFINEQLIKNNISRLPDFYLMIYRNSFTELSQPDFQNALDGLEKLCELNTNKNIASVIMFRPMIIDEILQYDEETLEQMRKIYESKQ